MMKTRLLFLTVFITITMSACSSDSDIQEKMDSKAKGEHIWKAQTDALKQAEAAGKLANEMVEQQRKTLDKLNQERLTQEQ